MVIGRYKRIMLSIIGKCGIDVLRSFITSTKDVLIYSGRITPIRKLNTSNRPIRSIAMVDDVLSDTKCYEHSSLGSVSSYQFIYSKLF